jgi:hypothetical protein
MSRQALILRRRHTQQSGSVADAEVSPPQTEHLADFFSLSAEIACFACSSISTGTTGSSLVCGLRLIPSLGSVSLWQKHGPRYNYYPVKCVLSSFRNLYYNSDIQRGSTARTPLSRGYARVFSLEIDIGRNRMRADWAVYVAEAVIFNKCFHNVPSLHPTRKPLQRLYQNRKDF